MIGARRYAGPSRASATTLCQKCLKRGHYSYECTVTPSERPYNTRPSRTQQLANPKLKPKITNDAPLDLLRKEGVADETLAKRSAERARQRSTSSSPSATHRRRPSRTPSSESVSTISTNRSRSHSPRHGTQDSSRMQDVAYPSQRESQPSGGRARLPSGSAAGHKRRRRSSSGSSPASRSPSRSRSSVSSASSYHRHRPRKDYSNSPSGHERNIRRRRKSVSPGARGRERRDLRDPYSQRSTRRRSRSWSRDRGNIARHRQSMTPEVESRVRGFQRRGSPLLSPLRLQDDSRQRDRHMRRQDGGKGRAEDKHDVAPPKPRERSLSPFSKRVALTQAMNRGR